MNTIRPFHIALPLHGPPEEVSNQLVEQYACTMGRIDPRTWNDVNLFGLGHQVVYHNAGFSVVPVRSPNIEVNEPVPRLTLELAMEDLAALKKAEAIAEAFAGDLDASTRCIVDPAGYVWQLNAGSDCVPGRVTMHLPVRDVPATAEFLGSIPLCETTSVNSDEAEIVFFEHRVFLYRREFGFVPEGLGANDVDGKAIQVPHFGPILTMPAWTRFAEEVSASGVELAHQPMTRFAGQRGEQGTVFIKGPDGILVEVKGFVHDDQIFAVD